MTSSAASSSMESLILKLHEISAVKFGYTKFCSFLIFFNVFWFLGKIFKQALFVWLEVKKSEVESSLGDRRLECFEVPNH